MLVSKDILTNLLTNRPPLGSGDDGVTYSEVTTGVNPTYAALGVLTTGALGSVLYSYGSQDGGGLATSATAFAKVSNYSKQGVNGYYKRLP